MTELTNHLLHRTLLSKEKSKMAPHMAATVLSSSVFVLFLLVFPVFCFSNTISFTRDVFFFKLMLNEQLRNAALASKNNILY